MRNGLHAAKAIALGASAAGIALPVIRWYSKGGKKLVKQELEKMIHELKTAMFLTGSKNIQSLKGANIVVTGELASWCFDRGVDCRHYALRSSGRTIIEKFETYSNEISFAIVLLTPDDIGGINVKDQKQLPRARQNVIMELGYFMGRLGRKKVCALHKGGIELPSDYQGVVYIPMDSAGAWKAKVAQELIQAKLSIDVSGLVGG